MPTNPQEQEISFGGQESPKDYRTITADMVGDKALPPEKGFVPLDFDEVDELCNQRRLGVCTMCAVRMAAEQHFKDGVRLSEYWGYLMGKTFVDGNLKEGSSALTMLKTANKWGIPSRDIEEQFPLKVDGSYKDFIEHFQETYGTIPPLVLEDALLHKIPGYYSVSVDPISIANEIAKQKLVVCRLRVGESFYQDKNGKYTRDPKKLFPLRAPKKVETGHLMVINEHDGVTSAQVLEGPNSWSRTWGNDGYFEFVFKTQAPEYFTEAWAIMDKVPEVFTHVKQLPDARNFKYSFPKKMEYGQSNEEVKKLHIALSILGYMNVAIDEWGIYGNKTAAAVLAYQKAKKLQPVAQLNKNKGYYVYDLTLAALRKDFNK